MGRYLEEYEFSIMIKIYYSLHQSSTSSDILLAYPPNLNPITNENHAQTPATAETKPNSKSKKHSNPKPTPKPPASYHALAPHPVTSSSRPKGLHTASISDDGNSCSALVSRYYSVHCTCSTPSRCLYGSCR
ncbi:hypothetical protein P167DRAFT_340622 [Morchella conica CCBAS932]|uniref:Uncharacterized protein n=1 Tax=Morchella conica CCBAS932 TaxID=1392247 RepID=A0A3N4KE79_9PEZI|nr:hypothetical protein P167DRAFT_396640 [Morchella conica CCBAS932]RPB08482.1 hypothetical protein P167DRAFT_340622 [Morchella conica CCBAS932]